MIRVVGGGMRCLRGCGGDDDIATPAVPCHTVVRPFGNQKRQALPLPYYTLLA